MLVVTDGINDVAGKNDDPGLLSGDSGRDAARDAIAGSKHSVWLMGAGFPKEDELRYLAGSAGRARFADVDPVSLARLLNTILAEMTPTRLVAYAIPAGPRADLGRRRRQFRLDAMKTSLLTWRPPLVALPPFQGDADSTLLLQPRVSEMSNDLDSDMNQRLLIGIPVLLILVFAHWVLPRLMGVPDTAAAGVGATASSAASPAGPPAKVPSKPNATVALRPVTEAPPRSPSDITKDAAR